MQCEVGVVLIIILAYLIFPGNVYMSDFLKILKDNIILSDNGIIGILESYIRANKEIHGVLVLSGNKTYGKVKKRFLYKCIPDDMRLPSFLIPFEIKSIGFSKIFKNKYISFVFSSWESKNPHGRINQNFGDSDNLINFYEYQLSCKGLNVTNSTFSKKTYEAIKSLINSKDTDVIEHIVQRSPDIYDRTNLYVFSIDPPNSRDFDDAFSIQSISDDKFIVSVYISNVTSVIDILDLWTSFSERISTIYLPESKRTMLPSILSDSICSLQENEKRVAFVMDLTICGGNIEDIAFLNAGIIVQKNYEYEEKYLLENPDYKSLFLVVKELCKRKPYIKNLKDSHDMVAYLMVLMNHHCAQKMKQYKTGIFRSTMITKCKKSCDTEMQHANIPSNVKDFITIYNSGNRGHYIRGDSLNSDEDAIHAILELDAYIHITSPIRRIVDLLNMIALQHILGLGNLSNHASKFYESWLEKIDLINKTTQSIKKVQMDCNLLDLCNRDMHVLNNTYKGFIFNKTIHSSFGQFLYIVYISDINMTSQIISTREFDNFQAVQLKLYIFNDENRLKKKIRIMIV